EVESRIIGQMGHLKPIDSSPELFKTSLEEKLPYLHLSFDQREGETLEIGGNLLGLEEISAKVTKGKELPVLTPGQFGNAMQFNGQGRYVQTNWEGVSGSAPRSVAFWCKLPKSSDSNTTQDACGFVAWGNQRVYGSKFVIVINRDSDAGKLGAIRFDCGQGYAIGESKLTDGEWHHVAVVMAGEVDPSLGMDVQVYVDGERETLTGFRPNTPDTTPGTNNNSWMSVGRYRLPGMSFHKTLTGTLDELYVFPSFLTRSDVQQIMNGDW
ncbi:LamG domain-containing protein, partial [bacterium]|nr:LamG domain-containing protein [bacterium]